MNWKGFGKKHHGLIEVLSRNLPGGTEKTAKDLSQDWQCLGDWIRAPSGYKSRAALLVQPPRFVEKGEVPQREKFECVRERWKACNLRWNVKCSPELY
jgi:hypothetical protein